MLKQLKDDLRALANPEKALVLQRFFKTGPGEYGEGDKFLGITVPLQRQVAKKYLDISLNKLSRLIQSPFHEERLTSLLILVAKYKKMNQKEYYDFYLDNIKYINNWDLVDLSAPHIVGSYLFSKSRKILFKLAKDKNLWARRIAVLATFYFIRQHDFSDTLKLAELLLHDEEDLLHKAVGWMLREIGKRDLEAEEEFLQQYYQEMPRTMLRYAIEKFSDKKRAYYLQ